MATKAAVSTQAILATETTLAAADVALTVTEKPFRLMQQQLLSGHEYHNRIPFGHMCGHNVAKSRSRSPAV